MASEIRVDKINSLSGVGTVTLSPTGVDISGITTAATLRATTGIVTSLTAGSLTSLGAISGTTGTFSGAVSGTTGTFSGDVSVAGDLQVPDVIKHEGDVNTKIRFPEADTITVETAGSERFRIDSDGRLLHKHTASRNVGTKTGQLQVINSGNDAAISIIQTNNAGSAPFLCFGKTRSANTTGSTIVQDGDSLGQIVFAGADGTDIDSTGALITAQVDGTPGSNDMPGRLIFSTTVDGATTSTERLRLTSAGRLGLNTDSPDTTFTIKSGGDAQMSLKNSSGTTKAYLGTDGAFGSASTDDLRIRSDSSNIIFGFSGTEKVRMLSSGGITFNGDTATANALDDYEEGNYAPTNHAGTATLTNNTTARYRKIGQMVYVQYDVSISSTDSGTNAGMTMPFANSVSYGSGAIGWTTLGRPVFMHISGGYAYFMDNSTSGSSSQHLIFNETNGHRFIGSFWYIHTG